MASTKPVADGFHDYGFEMIYLYLVQRSVGTLQDGRAVEHWNPETGEVNTSNVNFPWAASCMAGSIWRELTEDEQAEYLQRFHINCYPMFHVAPSDVAANASQAYESISTALPSNTSAKDWHDVFVLPISTNSENSRSSPLAAMASISRN